MKGTKKTLSFLPLPLVILLVLAGCSATSQLEPVGDLLGTISSTTESAAGDNLTSPDLPPVSSPSLMAAADGTLTQIYEEVNPSVVHIQVVKSEAGLSSFIHPEVPGAPDGSTPGELPQAFGEGSGFVWDKEGHIVTNNHVVEGAEKITVVFADETAVKAELVGADPDSDLAVLKVDLPAGQLKPVQLGDSADLQVGELAIAIGNPFGQEGTMTVGIISALGRLLPVDSGLSLSPRYNIPDIIQTDAAINPGNSGGVLLNDQGQLIGVTTAILSGARTSSGVGFAVPAAIVENVVPALIEDGEYIHPYLGISGGSLTAEIADAMNLPADQRGVLVATVVPDGPAGEAGLQGNDEEVKIDGFDVGIGGDVITAIEDQPLDGMDDLITYLERSTRVGQTVELTILRNGQQEAVSVTLAPRPKPVAEPVVQEGSGQAVQPGEPRAWLGILGAPVTPEVAEAMDLPAGQTGVLIQQVEPGSPADDAGLQGSAETITVEGQDLVVGGDIIIALDGAEVAGLQDLLAILANHGAGDEVTLDLLRDGEQISIPVTLGKRSE